MFRGHVKLRSFNVSLVISCQFGGSSETLKVKGPLLKVCCYLTAVNTYDSYQKYVKNTTKEAPFQASGMIRLVILGLLT